LYVPNARFHSLEARVYLAYIFIIHGQISVAPDAGVSTRTIVCIDPSGRIGTR
jgi:hypothetical protein